MSKEIDSDFVISPNAVTPAWLRAYGAVASFKGWLLYYSYIFESTPENDRFVGSGGDDWMLGGAGADFFDGGRGRDGVDYSASRSGVTVDLGEGRGSGGDAEGDEFASVEAVRGSDHDDRIFGDNGANMFFASRGDDRYDGRGGDDALSYSGQSGAIRVNLMAGAVDKSADRSTDRVSNIETIIGTDHRDEFGGDHRANRFEGGAGNDLFHLDDGADVYIGGAGSDEVVVADDGIVIDLAQGVGGGRGASAGDVYESIERIKLVGDYFDLTGGDAHNRFDVQGYGVIDAGGGHDVVKVSTDVLTPASRFSDSSFDGGEGYDTLDYSAFVFTGIGVDFNLRRGFVADRLAHSILPRNFHEIDNFERVIGGSGDDDFEDITGAQSFRGGGGGDYFYFGGWGGARIGDYAEDVLEDFRAGEDKILIRSALRHVEFGSAEWRDAVYQDGADAIIRINEHNDLRVLNVNASAFVEEDILFY